MIRKTMHYKGVRIEQHYASTGFTYSALQRVFTSLKETKDYINDRIKQQSK